MNRWHWILLGFGAWHAVGGRSIDLFSERLDTSVIAQAKVTCPKCKKANPPAAKFCNSCGGKLSASNPVSKVASAASGFPAVTRLTTDYAVDHHPSWGPNGKIAFSSRREGGEDIFTMNSDGSDQKQITKSDSLTKFEPCWGPEGQLLYSGHLSDTNIYSIRTDGTNLAKLTDFSSFDGQASWAKDGRIVFASNRDRYTDIYVMGPDGSDTQRILERASQPCWGQNGKIVFQAERNRSETTGQFNCDIYVMDSDGSNMKRLTTPQASDEQPSWGPDGRIAFVSERDGQKEIYIMNADGSGQRRLTNNKAEDENPALGVDGSILFYSRRGPGDGDVYVMKVPAK